MVLDLIYFFETYGFWRSGLIELLAHPKTGLTITSDGGVLRDNFGRIIHAFASNLGLFSTTFADPWTILLGVKLAS